MSRILHLQKSGLDGGFKMDRQIDRWTDSVAFYIVRTDGKNQVCLAIYLVPSHSSS